MAGFSVGLSAPSGLVLVSFKPCHLTHLCVHHHRVVPALLRNTCDGFLHCNLGNQLTVGAAGRETTCANSTGFNSLLESRKTSSDNTDSYSCPDFSDITWSCAPFFIPWPAGLKGSCTGTWELRSAPSRRFSFQTQSNRLHTSQTEGTNRFFPHFRKRVFAHLPSVPLKSLMWACC